MIHEVKVGQVWVRDVFGYEVSVIKVEDKDLGFVDLAFRDKNGGIHLSKERKDYFLTRYNQKAVDSEAGSSNLRDHFAGLAMQGYIANVGQGFFDEIADKAYQIADAMLKARGE